MVNIFQLWEYNQYILPLELAITEKNSRNTIRLIKKLLEVVQSPWNLSEAILFSHISSKEQKLSLKDLTKMLKEIFEDNSKLEFIQIDPKFKNMY